MHLYINQLLFVLAHFRIFILTESARNELIPLVNITNACPGDVLMYQCNIVGSGNTIWTGTAFSDCSNNEIILRHSTFASGMAFGNCNNGAISARGLGVDNNCYSSQLNVTVNSDLNNKTIRCDHSSDTVVTIRTVTLSVATVPPMNVKLAEVSPGELVFNWTASADSPADLYFIVNSTCGTCPNMTNMTMVTCSNLNLSTIATVCTFSVRSAVCGTIGSPSPPAVVTLGVPDVPNVAVIPQYSLNDGQLLTKVIVRINQTATSFPVTDSISGSTTSYDIFYSGNNIIVMLNVTACMEDTCEYIVDVPSFICSMSANVDITIAAANRLGMGPRSTEPITVECTNRFVRVSYDPTATTISCTFENRLDSSIKSCDIKYGTCGQEMYTTQGNTTVESPFMVRLKLNSNILNSMSCYIVTASNETLTLMVKGEFITQSNNDSVNTSILAGTVIGVIIIIMLGLVVVTVIILILVLSYKRKLLGNQDRTDASNRQFGLEMESDVKKSSSQLIQINSMQFKMSKVNSLILGDCTLDDLKRKVGKYVFLEHTHHSSEEVLDVILREKNGTLFSGPAAQSLELQRDWDKVFVLPLNSHGGEVLHKNEFILHQDRDQLKKKFKVIRTGKNYAELSKFLMDQNLDFEREIIFYQFPKAGMDLLHYREVIRVSNSKLDQLRRLKQLSPDEELILESGTGIDMFYDLRPRAPGRNIRPPDVVEGCFVQITSQELRCRLKAGSLILVYKDKVNPEDHRA